VKADRPMLEVDLEAGDKPSALSQQQIGALARETARR
jgi:hypothetical protein